MYCEAHRNLYIPLNTIYIQQVNKMTTVIIRKCDDMEHKVNIKFDKNGNVERPNKD